MPRAEHGVSQGEVDRLNAAVLADPDIRKVLEAERTKLQQTRDQGGAARQYQNTIRDLVTHIAQRKGLIPEGRYFVNPNDGQLEPHRGWAGLSGLQKGLAIAGAAAATLATAGAFGVGPMAGVFGGGGGGAASGAAAAAPEFAYSSTPIAAGGLAPGTLAASNAAWGATTTAGGGAGVLDRIWGGIKKVGRGAQQVTDFVGDHKEAAALAALPAILAALKNDDRPGTSGLPSPAQNPFGDLDTLAAPARDAYALQQRRVAQGQPAFDALVSQAYGMTPTRYRGAPPEGYPAAAQEPAAGAYPYRGPQFG